jgi:trigger factor
LKVEYNEETPVRKSLTFEIEPEVVSREIESRAQEYARKVKLPGFRAGKVPAHVIRQRFRDQVLQDVAEKIVNKVVPEELEGRGLKPLASPKVTDLKIDEDQPMTFKAVFETLPFVQLPEYRGLPAKGRRVSVTEEDVDKEVDRLREEAARYDPIEGRAALEGDFALLDVAWKPVEGGGRGGRDENTMVELGSADNHADLNAALVGMSPGETRDVRLVYPADHPSPRLQGRTVDYTVSMKAIKQKLVPAADDDLAKDLGDFDSLAALRQGLRKGLEEAEERRVDREVKGALVEALVQRASLEVPEALVERHMMARTESAARGLASQGIDPSKAGVDWSRYRDSQREQSVSAAKADILLDEVARQEGIETSDAELDAEVERLAERMRKSKEALRHQMEKEGDLDALRARIREEKVLDLLKAHAELSFE